MPPVAMTTPFFALNRRTLPSLSVANTPVTLSPSFSSCVAVVWNR